ncbi:MAG: MBOAT family protein [Okeania sp. SIO3H1]|uniref:MBOAT family O-acyltransferase n=1 Tax=Okeania sp. SIO1I7 TaxID=2607772 RepID=UPI0013C7F47D|nr:MBOAT family O-acyltransferase [Okeania sp. SIO1I7]NEN89697.1 MBOAT family protein [Okeania sp. SIO3H1]NET28769.1 MBOAT family protein [Okeania sp. SIO1I7]
MNFSDFSFWWVLLIFSVPFFTIRALGKRLNFWQDYFDTIGLMVLSLTLFLNASLKSFAVFIFEVIFNYIMVRLMLQRRGWESRAIATFLIVFDVAVLAYFKYLTFFVEDVVGLVVGGMPPNWEQSFPLPVFNRIPPGISFYTFQMVAFVVDSFTAKKKKPINFIDYVNFIAFFPQIVAGPIERRKQLLPQLESFKFQFTVENFELGLRWLSLGLFMKFVLADNITPYIDLQQATNALLVWFHAFLFTLRIYFDFGGYSFMAVGIARFVGVKLELNFLAPYTSVSIQEFWRRWHITLSNWFRDYVFIPLMGANKKWAPFYLFITFTLSGFWHGAAWNFILWGAYHGALLLLIRYAGRPFQRFVGRWTSRTDLVSWALTFMSVTLGCLFFMETNISRLGTKLVTLVTPGAYSISGAIDAFSSYSINEGWALVFTLAVAIGTLFLEHLAVWQQRDEYEFLLSPWISRGLLGLTILLGATIPSAFIYFEF